VLLNSFATSADTRAALEAEEGWELMQNSSPMVDAATLRPAVYEAGAEMEW
jgi:hypothetical protein